MLLVVKMQKQGRKVKKIASGSKYTKNIQKCSASNGKYTKKCPKPIDYDESRRRRPKGGKKNFGYTEK